MSDVQDLYATLGVPPDASVEDIRQAYRIAARRLHPDVNSSPGAANQFRDITAAYEVLNDPVARQKYDMKRAQAGAGKRYFSVRLTPSRRVLTVMPEPQVVYVLVEIVPNSTIDARQTNTPLNLTLLVDRSTSMNGPRLDRVKIASHQLIDELSGKDVLSLISFSDKADVMLKAAPLADKVGAKALVTMMSASGGTEMLQGMLAAAEQVRRYAGKNFVNHIIMITDGRTYGDEPACLELAEKLAAEGIGVSAMGLGDEWNDTFLDQIASRTGGVTEYITSPNAVVHFLNDRVRALGNALAERLSVSLAPDPDVKIESAFRLTPMPQPVLLESDPILLGQLQARHNTSVLIQLQLPPLKLAG
ncbi:MAG: DnaJ domain-containing protein, partial [Anaerolineae bacterium]|nr:DnaJ domain-containing protein [Anaerolineae bacterium]